MPGVLLTASALALGFLHGLGADHLMAIAALSVRPGDHGGSRTHPVRVAVGFAIGHALLLLAGSALVILLGWQIPVLVERTGERVGGILLILLGAFGLWVVFNQRLYGHTHAHGDPPHVHYHVHFGHAHGHRTDGHQHLPGLLGAVFAVSGLRAITLMAPIGSALDGNVMASMLTVAYLVVDLRGRHPPLDVALRHCAVARPGVGGDRPSSGSWRRRAHGRRLDGTRRVLDCRELTRDIRPRHVTV